MDRVLARPEVRRLVLGLCLLPWLWLVWGAMAGTLGPNPAETLIRSTGDWTLRLLCLTLAVTPLRVSLGLAQLARWRRPLGLYTAFYALWHVLAYAWLDMGLELTAIVINIGKRPFILVGAVAALGLALLAATSFNRAVRWLGAARWQALHRLVYAVAALALLHFFWMRAGKNDFAEVGVYAAIVGLLMAWRLWRFLGQKWSNASSVKASQLQKR